MYSPRTKPLRMPAGTHRPRCMQANISMARWRQDIKQKRPAAIAAGRLQRVYADQKERWKRTMPPNAFEPDLSKLVK